jgi:hypothetical protein
VKRWADLYQHIEGLLQEDFMSPKDYVKLLTDDDLSQSRLYFWIIGCLNEFDVSIGDNIKQWGLFQEARVEPFLEDTKLGTNPIAGLELEQFQALRKEAHNLREALEVLRSQFQNKLTTVRALRDGVSYILTVSFLYST